MASSQFIILLLGLGIFSLIIGVYAAKHIRTTGDYFLAGRQVGVWPLMLTLCATQIGGGLILGTADEAYQIGWYGILYAMGIFLGFALLASGFASKLRGFNIVTTAQLFETHYQSRTLRKLASLIIVISMCGILVGQVVAAKKFMFALGMTQDWLFIAFWAFVIVYTMIGGLKAVILTDVYQVLFIIALFIGLFIFAIIQYPFSDLQWVPAEPIEDLPIHFVAPLLLPFLFCIVEQDLAQRCFAARTRKVATLAAALAAVIVLLFGIIPTYFGVLAQHLGLEIANNTSVLVSVIAEISHGVVLSLVAVALLAAIISTSDSLLCAISSNLAQDFGLDQLSDRLAVHLSRGITLLCGVIALVLAYQFDNIIRILIHSYELPVSALFVAIFFCCIAKRTPKLAAIVSITFGIVAFGLLKFISTPFPREILQLIAAFTGYGLGWWLDARQRHG
ncbi:MAG: sodium:solute symporter family protein [Legionellales bacterium]|nr:sodium:solute symporter family protein [Legionellales bacterium]